MGRQLQVAVKVLDLDRFPTKMDDFLKEAAIMNSLDHPDIVRLYGICVAPKCLRLVSHSLWKMLIFSIKGIPLGIENSPDFGSIHNFSVKIDG